MTAPEGRPLAGRRVVVTRPRRQAGALVAALAELGAEVVCLPAIVIEPAPPPPSLAAGSLGRYDWIVFTSENGVERLLDEVARQGGRPGDLAPARIAAVGAATAAALARAGVAADLVPATALGAALLADLLAAGPLTGRRVLRVRGDRAATALEEGLRAAGAEVDVATLYRTRPAPADPAAAADLRRTPPAAVTFASGSAVAGFARLFPDGPWLAVAPAVCIGEPTAEAARRAGWRTVTVAASAASDDLARAVVRAVAAVRE